MARRREWFSRKGRAGTISMTREEAFRVLRSNLEVVIADLENPVVVITSANPGEGKTSLCVNLAESLAAAGSRVVLVDLDLRNPDSHRLLGAHNERGVGDVLLDEVALEQALQYVELPSSSHRSKPGFYFLATGSPVTNPTELLGTPRTGRMLHALAAQADIVLLDTPPVLPVADTLVIGRLAAGAVLVVEARRTPIPAVERAKAALTRNQTRLLGVVVNKLQTRDTGGAYGYGYGYGYGSPRAAVEEAGQSPEVAADGAVVNGVAANGNGAVVTTTDMSTPPAEQ